MTSRPLHVLVGVAPPAGPEAPLGLGVDLQLVKAALLYGDSVTLCSPAASLAARVLDTTTEAALDTLVALADDFELGEGPRQLAAARAEIERDRGPYAAERLARLDAIAAEWWEQVRGALQAQLAAGGYGELVAAARSGVVRLDPLGVGALASPADFSAVASDAYADRVDAALAGLAVPLLDGATLDGLRQRRAGVAEPAASAAWRAREGGLVADWLPRLPLFDRATLDETLGVRRELAPYIARFRAAVVAFAEGVEPAVWAPGFPHEAERLFRRDVAPAVSDIADAVAETGALRALVSRYAERPGLMAPFGPALALGLADPSLGAEIGALAIAGGAVAANAARAWWLDRDARRSIEANRLFFVYAAGRQLDRGRP